VAGLEYAESIVIDATPERVYDVVSDITRTGEWSPICTGCAWDAGAGPQVGAMFTGHNETPERVWETRCEVVAADRGREFAWTVGQRWVRWGYTLRAVDGGTELTESWHFLPAGLAGFAERFGADAQAQIENRTRAARVGIPATLAAIKRAIEAG
jgi:hypothetical protein